MVLQIVAVIAWRKSSSSTLASYQVRFRDCLSLSRNSTDLRVSSCVMWLSKSRTRGSQKTTCPKSCLATHCASWCRRLAPSLTLALWNCCTSTSSGSIQTVQPRRCDQTSWSRQALQKCCTLRGCSPSLSTLARHSLAKRQLPCGLLCSSLLVCAMNICLSRYAPIYRDRYQIDRGILL